MDNFVILIVTGCMLGTLGTLIGAGGGFLLVPLLIFAHPNLSPEVVTAISIAIVACNAMSGSVAYARLKRIDYKAGLLFAAFTIPGSIAGVYTTQYIPKTVFNIVFGVLLIVLAIFLFLKKPSAPEIHSKTGRQNHLQTHTITDSKGSTYQYSYHQNTGIFISIIVGYLSPLLGIGGGIIHVPALVNWLRFPVVIATATSHFILAIMATVSVIVHIVHGNYSDPHLLHMVIGLGIGVIAGAQIGAFLSHKIQGNMIIRALAVCLGLVGIRILLTSL